MSQGYLKSEIQFNGYVFFLVLACIKIQWFYGRLKLTTISSLLRCFHRVTPQRMPPRPPSTAATGKERPKVKRAGIWVRIETKNLQICMYDSVWYLNPTHVLCIWICFNICNYILKNNNVCEFLQYITFCLSMWYHNNTNHTHILPETKILQYLEDYKPRNPQWWNMTTSAEWV